jgi:hypothetical protein
MSSFHINFQIYVTHMKQANGFTKPITDTENMKISVYENTLKLCTFSNYILENEYTTHVYSDAK